MLLLLLLQVDITLNTQNNNIINITNEKYSCLCDTGQNVMQDVMFIVTNPACKLQYH